MTDERSLTDWLPEIDRRLEAVFEPESGAEIPLAQRVTTEYDDRWYGQLVVASVESVSESGAGEPGAEESGTAKSAGDEPVGAEPVATEAVLSAAVAIELLRGYCRLRSELLVQVTNEAPHSLTQDPTSSLLAGDLLFSAAYSELGAVDRAPDESLFETLANVSRTTIEALAANYVQSTATVTDLPALIDDTAGALGEGATRIGASLAGVTVSQREQFATVGRGLGVARQIRRGLDSDASSLPVVPPERDEEALRRHANRRMEEATRALDALSSSMNVEHLRPFVERIHERGDNHPG